MSHSMVLAGRGRRALATVIDLLSLPVIGIVLMLVTGILEHAEDFSSSGEILMRTLILGVMTYLIANGWLLYHRGQTLGKAIMGVRIVAADSGAAVAFWKLLIRMIFFPTLYLTVLFPYTVIPFVDQLFIFGKQRRCLHDFLCGTCVAMRE